MGKKKQNKAQIIDESMSLSNASIITSVIKPMRSLGVVKSPDRKSGFKRKI
jgi:hypothetical protein